MLQEVFTKKFDLLDIAQAFLLKKYRVLNRSTTDLRFPPYYLQCMQASTVVQIVPKWILYFFLYLVCSQSKINFVTDLDCCREVYMRSNHKNGKPVYMKLRSMQQRGNNSPEKKNRSESVLLRPMLKILYIYWEWCTYIAVAGPP